MSDRPPLYMIRSEVDERELQRWMGTRRLQDRDHAMHCLLIECFGNSAPRPFRMIAPRNSFTGTLYGYTTSDADAMRHAIGAYACPLQSKVIPAHTIDCKLMPENWKKGELFGFEVRVRPTRRIYRPLGPGGQRRLAECDAFLMQTLDDAQETGNREDVYREWLRERLQKDGAACLNTAEMKSFQRIRSYRKRNAKRYSEGPDALMRGDLTVGDGDAFANLLTDGIGRHRAYGYGMLMLRPALRDAGQ